MTVAVTPAVSQHINPTAESVKEDQLLKEAKRISGECTLPDQKACTLEQPRGRDWQYWYQTPLRLIGGLAILGMIAVALAFYFIRGPLKIEHGRTGRIMAKKRKRKYARGAGTEVEREMHRYKRGKAKSGKGGKGGKVKSRKQAIAIGLSKARKKGKRVPSKKR